MLLKERQGCLEKFMKGTVLLAMCELHSVTNIITSIHFRVGEPVLMLLSARRKIWCEHWSGCWN